MTTARRRQASSTAKAEQAGESDATAGNESKYWKMADALRGSMDAAEYKHVVLGLIFLKYISDAFEEAYAQLEEEIVDGADPEDPDEYRAQSIFWVPPEARWQHLKNQARQPAIGRLVDDAMTAVERDNPALTGVLPKEYARPTLDKTRLGQVVDLVSDIKVGGAEAQATDVLGGVYEYFLEQFALAECRKGGEFYTPRSVVRLLVEMLEPYQGRVYDPCCGSSGMFVQSVEFIQAHASGNGNGGASRARSSTATASTTTAIRTFGPTTSWPIRPSTSPTGAASGCGTTSGGSTASRRRATPTSPGCSTSCTTWRLAARRASCWPTAPCRRASPARVRSART